MISSLKRALLISGWIVTLLVTHSALAVPPQKEITSDKLPQVISEINLLTQRYLDPEIRKRDNRFIVKLNEGRLHYFKEDYRSAAMTLLELVETYQGNSKKTPVYKDALFYLADSLYHIGNYRTALKFFEKVLTLGEPKMRPCALGRLIETSLKTNKLEEGMKYFREANQYNRKSSDDTLLYLIGKFNYHLNRHNEAITSWKRVSKDSSIYPQALYFTGVSQVHLGDLDNAVNTFKEVIALDLDAMRINLNLKVDQGLTPEVDVITGSVIQAGSQSDEQSAVTGCTFRSDIEKQNEAQGWNIVQANAELAIARILYERGHFDKSFAAYVDVNRNSPLFLEAIKESVWVSIRQQKYLEALQRMEVQLIDEPNMLYDPFSRLLQARLLSILGRFTEAKSIFGELKERFDIFKARALTPVLSKARGQLAQYFQRKLERGDSFLDLSSLLPKEAIQFTKNELSTSASKSLFVELSALSQDVKTSKAIIKDLYWVLDAPNQSEIFPKLHDGLLAALGLRYRLFRSQSAQNETKSRRFANDPRYQKLRLNRELAAEKLREVPQNAATLKERESKMERQLAQLDLKLFRQGLILKYNHSQLIGAKIYLEDNSPDVINGILKPEQRTKAIDMTIAQLAEHDQLVVKINALSEKIKKVYYRVGLFDEVYIQEEELRGAYASALEEESEWLVTQGGMDTRDLNAFNRGHQIIDDFQIRSMRLVSDNSSLLRQQVIKEEAKIKRYEIRLKNLTRQANRLAGQMVAKIFYQVINKLDGLILEADAGYLDMLWAKKNESRSCYRMNERADASTLKCSIEIR